MCTSCNGQLEGGISAYSALQGIATGADTFFNHPGPGELKSIFTQIAGDISGTRLIEDESP